jgi:hypothetical protein
MQPRHEGGYYGYALRDLLSDRPPATMSERNRRMRALWVVGIVVVIAAVAFAVLVNL